MTASEAIKMLEIQKPAYGCKEYQKPLMYAYEMAIKALEKQIPKKPNKAIDSSWGIQKEAHTCPVCDYYLTEVHFIEPQKIESNKKITYCETCGQAIDWSDEE